MPRKKNLYFSFAVLALLFSLSFKEPFLLIYFATLLLCHRLTREFFTYVLSVCLTTLLMGVVILWAFNLWGPYVEIYLPHMLLDRIHIDATSAWLRGLQMQRLFYVLKAFIPALGYYLLYAFLGLIVLMLSSAKKMSAIEKFLFVFKTILAVYGVSFTVGLGGDYLNHHFVFALPFYLSLSIEADRYVRKMPPGDFVFLPLSLCLLLLFFSYPDLKLIDRFRNYQQEEATAKQEAILVDQLLEACHLDRYLFLGNNRIYFYGWTKHSPLGPAMVQLGYFYNHKSTWFFEGFQKAVAQAPVLFLKDYAENVYQRDIRKMVKEKFQTQAPACALPYVGLFPKETTLLWKKP